MTEQVEHVHVEERHQEVCEQLRGEVSDGFSRLAGEQRLIGSQLQPHFHGRVEHAVPLWVVHDGGARRHEQDVPVHHWHLVHLQAVEQAGRYPIPPLALIPLAPAGDEPLQQIPKQLLVDGHEEAHDVALEAPRHLAVAVGHQTRPFHKMADAPLRTEALAAVEGHVAHALKPLLEERL